MPYGVVYKITNEVTKKCYIGQTRQGLRTRWKAHVKRAVPGVKHPLYASMVKHGVSSFFVEVIAEASSQEELNSLEVNLGQQNKALVPTGYSLRLGGAQGVWSPEARAHLSMACKGIVKSDSHRKAMSEAQKARDPSSREAALAKTRSTCNTSEFSKKVSDSWKNPVTRSKRISSMTSIPEGTGYKRPRLKRGTPEFHERHSRAVTAGKAAWTTEQRHTFSEKMRLQAVQTKSKRIASLRRTLAIKRLTPVVLLPGEKLDL